MDWIKLEYICLIVLIVIIPEILIDLLKLDESLLVILQEMRNTHE